MRTLMVAPQPFFQPRGTPFSVLHRLKALAQLGYKIDLLTYHIGQDIPIDGVNIYRIPKIPFVKKIAVGPSRAKIALDLAMIWKTASLLSKNSYDLIHSHEEAGFWAAYFAKKRGMLHLYDMHSSLPQQLNNFQFTKSGFLKKAFDKLEAFTIDSAAAVITICPELHDYVKAHFPDKYNCLIENVADNSLVFNKKIDVEAIKKRVKTNGEYAVLYAGTFEAYQGLDMLIESSVRVIEKAPNVRFVLVGGKPEQVARYEQRVEQLHLSKNFVFTGSVIPEEVPAYIESCDMLVSPRLEGNNTPLKIYSYLRSGKPIVATDHITHTQVLNKDVSVLTDCTSQAFGDGILTALNDAQLSARITNNAKTLADEKYSYDVYLEKTKNLYGYLESQLGKSK